MNYLFIDTAEGTRALLCACGKYYYDENMKSAGSEILLPMIDGLLSRAGIKIQGVDIFGACIGPGSFTGLRIGLTTIKTFCYATGKPCFAVNNLRLNSYNNIGKSEKVISIADAGNRVCYIAVYDGEKELEPAKCVTVDDAKKIVESNPDYAVSTDVKLSSVFGGTAGVGEKELKIAAERHIANAVSEKELLPLYIRKPQPERGAGDL
ncbi:MAG: tRNA (adenosine(37)-N6)-threonylcarbamoyltransferase complex dimerization subunit type 1 TsaB [Clostridiales bacterium]|nr:tRNA (adenosine(37)-N6)-threonylcarbamoyltransferase complex dimerization subunit type 1 TsaB [Clostridiales bacterium]